MRGGKVPAVGEKVRGEYVGSSLVTALFEACFNYTLILIKELRLVLAVLT